MRVEFFLFKTMQIACRVLFELIQNVRIKVIVKLLLLSNGSFVSSTSRIDTVYFKQIEPHLS